MIKQAIIPLAGLVKKIKKFRKMIKFVYQNKPKGTGDAVLKCQKSY